MSKRSSSHQEKILIAGDVSERKGWKPNSLLIDRSIHRGVEGLVKSLFWFALCVPASKEFAAQEILKRNGLVTFLPMDKRYRKRNRYVKSKDLIAYPMMPRYVFAGFETPHVPWFHIFSLNIITSCVGTAGRPMMIEGKDMLKIVSKHRNGVQRPTEQRFMRTHGEFAVGDSVRVASDHPMAGWIMPVKELRGREAVLMMEFLGGSRDVTIPTDMLVAA